LINEIYLMCIEGLRCKIYYDYFISNQEKLCVDRINNDWWAHTLHAYYYLSITHWCRVFGSARVKNRGEASHYLELMDKTQVTQVALGNIGMNICDSGGLKAALIKNADISEAVFNEYQQKTLKYRNKYSVHREYIDNKNHINDMYHPEFEIMQKTFLSLCLILQRAAVFLSREKIKDTIAVDFYNIQAEKEFLRVALSSPTI
jgi:hypothetical protein